VTGFALLGHRSVAARSADRQAVGELTSRISIDTDRIEDGLVNPFSTLLPGLLSLIGFATVLLSVDWRFVSLAVRLEHGGVPVTEEVANNTAVPKIFIGASARAHHLFTRMGWRHRQIELTVCGISVRGDVLAIRRVLVAAAR
jgi:ABC-type multidrug transport system fused ATPase/permease subunit